MLGARTQDAHWGPRCLMLLRAGMHTKGQDVHCGMAPLVNTLSEDARMCCADGADAFLRRTH